MGGLSFSVSKTLSTPRRSHGALVGRSGLSVLWVTRAAATGAVGATHSPGQKAMMVSTCRTARARSLGMAVVGMQT